MAATTSATLVTLDLEDVLADLDLNDTIEKFKSERIDLDNFLSLTEQQLIRLGVKTIGDRLRLTERVRSEIKKRNACKQVDRNETLASQIIQQRNTLFNRNRNRRGQKRRTGSVSNSVDALDSSKIPRTRGTRTWTVTVVCLADTNAKKIPSVEEKTVLMKAGLGAKKIQFNLDDEEDDVLLRLQSDNINMRNGESIGFPQLQNSGGFELLNCKQNCRELTLINCHWNVRSLKSYIGNQAKIYIRPIQTSLDTTPKDQGDILTDAKVSCKACHCLFSVRELRAHIQTCVGGKSICENELLAQDLDSDDLPDPEIGRQGQLPVINPTESFIPLQTTDQEVNLNNTVLYFNPPFVFIPENETQPQMSTECIVPSIDRNSSTPIMKEDESNLPAASWTNGTGTLDDQSQNVSNRPLQAFLALQQSTTNSLDVTSAASCITSVEATVCANAHEPVFLSPESASEEKRQEDQTIEAVIATAIEYCLSHNIQDPVEMLRYLQSVIVRGRKLQIVDTSQCLEGATNFIIVDRNNILETAFEEIDSIADLRTTLEVQFYDETAEDLGGPRKEFFQLVLSEIKRKYFDSGLREHLAKDYLTVGKIMSLSVLQNGKLPKFMDPAILEDVFRDEDGSSDCIKNLRKGLNCLGLVKIGSVFPIFVHLFRPSQTTLTLKAVIQILKPVFSEEGSNSRQLENSVYSAYLKYLRAVASGRRGSVSLHHILQFATGTPEEPILGFTLQPSIHFFEVKSSSGFIPTANTCINNMKLPRPSYEIPLPSEEELFALYDYAFLNTFYGLF